ncbi:unnamed protein product (macronuclear) [Paramecium tetraurelia]|uniref:Chromo domain-containing protein n=1 Tax=Paramecium tetraurelia TaxID=5888 RepID=A0E5T9_PARTE|nr:uncharacterized protein GSPATT00003518001 [Paramecium tetraurelia]CAK90656.1 unnamed protein product [Paramecium tetraurelia]|eukprot:XP_001458053.1 hypothetical protein (macronuclear) [Paramecium tetraurelia strain d4-2]
MKHRQKKKQNSNLYIVEKIVDKRYDPLSKELQYCIKWEGYNEAENTWEPLTNLKNVLSEIEEFENQYRNKKYNKSLKIDNKKLKQLLNNKLSQFLEKIAPKSQQLQEINLSDYESSCEEIQPNIKQSDGQSKTNPDQSKTKTSILTQAYH